MRYRALACDYDGTIATDGEVDGTTIAALERLRASGRKLILVTGRELEDLMRVFPRITLFDVAVLENGALIYWPATREEQVLGEPPPEKFADTLRTRGVRDLSVGRVIVALSHPYETVVMETIRDLGLELQVIFNKGAVMVLPSGINKASGLLAALEHLGLSPHNIVGVGDAENDHAFLRICECSVAVANALPMLKAAADWVTTGSRGAGVIELIESMVSTDLAGLEPRLDRHHTPRAERQRHARKYAEGELGADRSFYFRGPEGKLNLRAQNLMVFIQMGEGVDDETWLHHLNCGDYEQWFRKVIKDRDLAAEAKEIRRRSLSANESRALIRAAIEKRYTAPA